MIKLINKLALSNLRQHRTLYFPFSLAVFISVTVFYIFLSIAKNPGIKNAPYGGSSMQAALGFGVTIVGITVLFIMAYANAYVRKNRTKELGLYTILGLEKRHLHLLSALEIFYFALVTIFLGLFFGLIFERLAFAILVRAMDYALPLTYMFQWSNVTETLLYFPLIFLILFLYNAVRLQFGKPLDLLKNPKKGEKQGRFLTIRALIGLALILVGYYLSITSTGIRQAIPTFFLAVLLVILGTFITFDAGIIRFLQFLKQRPNYYYKPQNFISISNLIFRMRKNAAGLASICVLSTMVLVTLTTSISLQTGTNVNSNEQYPYDFTFKAAYSDGENQRDILNRLYESKPVIDKVLKTSKDPVTEKLQYSFIRAAGKLEQENSFQFTEPTTEETFGLIVLVDIEDYNHITGQELTLDKGKVILFSSDTNKNKPFTNFQLGDKEFPIQEMVDGNTFLNRVPVLQEAAYAEHQATLVVPSLNDIYPDLKTTLKTATFFTAWNTEHSSDKTVQREQARLYFDQLNEDGWGFNMDYKVAYETKTFYLYGTLFFVGLFLSLLFFTGTVLVIYYKQISEGWEDRQRFDILQKVGLDSKMVKQTINRQVLTVFFLPIILALAHVAAAYPITKRILELLGVTDDSLILKSNLLVVAIFILAYFVVYRITSRSYLRIVKR